MTPSSLPIPSTEDPKSRLTKRDRIKVIYMPLVWVLLTAVLGTVIADGLQRRAFRRNELFRVRLERVMTSQANVAETLRQLEEISRQVRANEIFIHKQTEGLTPEELSEAEEFYRTYSDSSIVMLNDARLKMNSLGSYTATLTSSNLVQGAIDSFTRELDAYVNCLESNTKFEETCSDHHPQLMTTAREVVVAYSKVADALIHEYD